MPSPTLKKLYLAQSIADLESKTNIINDIQQRRTAHLVKFAKKLIKDADNVYLEKDEEKSYIQYFKFIELIMHIRSRKDFSTNDNDVKSLLVSANQALTRADSLKTSLIKRYTLVEEANLRSKNEKNNLISAQYSEKKNEPKSSTTIPEQDISLPEIPELSLSCKRLFELLFSGNNIIVMDVRSSEDFEESHIKHVSCISVPEEILVLGTTAVKLESQLSPTSLGSWYKRHEADHIVIVDWESENEFTSNSHIRALKEAMSKWDQNCKLKKEPLILSGGYKDWMLCYPMHTTKALAFGVTVKPSNSDPFSDLTVIEYPDLDEKPKIIQNNNDKGNFVNSDPLFKKVPVPNHILNSSSTVNNTAGRGTKSAPVVDRRSKPTLVHLNGPKSAAGERKVTPPQTIKNKLGVNGKSASETSEASSEEKVAMDNLDMANEILLREKEMENLRLRKGLEAEETMRMEVQKKEDLLMEKIKELEHQLKLSESNLKKFQEDNHAKEKVQEANSKKKELLEQVENLRKERKKQESASQNKVEPSKPREVSSAGSALKRSVQAPNHPNQANSRNSTYTIPLSREDSSDGIGRGLSRSHSSPNIAQMVNQEDTPTIRSTPSIDRSLKPKQTPPHQFAGILRSTQRDLHPVYGNCPARAATGLRNLGNTCFMNAVIQCLSNTVPLAEYFTSEDYIDDLNRDNRNRQGTGGELAEEFAAVIKALWHGQYKSFSPKDFKNAVSKCLSVCIGNEQQDSHEFLLVLMEKLHADLNRKAIRPVPKLESNADEKAFWQHHKKYNSSPIEKIFEGLLKSTLRCLSCRQTSDSFEVFSCLSLPILSSRCSLRDCIQYFLKPEKISGEAAWDCPRCKQKKEAEKRLHVSRLPEILVIQLKRFSYEGLWRRKLQTCVEFDFQIDVPCEVNSNMSSWQYYLYGVVNHFGTLEGGHYTAYCKSSFSNKWFKYDDHEVSEISSSDIQTSAAYLLFYRAVK